MKYKPVKFVIRFYLVVGWDIPYFNSTWDNNSGNKSGIPQPVRYCTLFRELKSVYERKIDTSLVKKDSSSAL